MTVTLEGTMTGTKGGGKALVIFKVMILFCY